MRYYFLMVALGLLVVVFALVGLVVAGTDALRRRRVRREGADASVIADSETEFETDVGRTTPDI